MGKVTNKQGVYSIKWGVFGLKMAYFTIFFKEKCIKIRCCQYSKKEVRKQRPLAEKMDSWLLSTNAFYTFLAQRKPAMLGIVYAIAFLEAYANK